MPLNSHFERLTPELLLPILTHLPDLESLDNLLQASPAAFRFFDIHGAEIIEAVLSSAVTHEYTCALIRISALVRCSSLPPQVYDLKRLQNLVRHESTSHRYDPPLWTLTSTRLSSDIPATVLRGILATHRKIICLAISCVKFYLNRFKPLRPSHLVDENFQWISNEYGPDHHYIPSWQLKPVEKPFPVQDIGPPTWVEEQRVLRAFWRVQLFHDLKTALNTSLISWPEKDIEWLNRMKVTQFYDVPISRLLDTIGEPYIYQQDGLLEHELIWSVMDYAKEDRQSIISPNFLQAKRDWPTPTAEGQRDLETIIDVSSWTYRFFYYVSGSTWTHEISGLISPLQHISFEPFRRLGFAIWDDDKMVNYGFLVRKPTIWDDSCLLAWKSILGRDEIAKVEKENQKRYDEATKSEPDEDEDDESE